MKLRDYQERAIEMVRERIRKGDKKIMIWMATGSGKGALMYALAKLIVDRGNRILIIMRRRELVFQTRKNFEKYGGGFSIGTIMGTEKGFDPSAQVQIASIDTISRRDISFLKDIKHIQCDESHDCMGNSYQEFLAKFNTSFVYGLTATPFSVSGKPHTFWDSCVRPITPKELCEQGYLIPCDTYAPKVIDTTGIKKVAGDFDKKELFKRASETQVIGDIVSTYKKYAMGKTAILFAVNIQHSQMLAYAFNQAGIPAIHCDQSHDKNFRANAIDQLKRSQIMVLCNVNIFSTGTDIPSAEVGIMARPTHSEVLWIQQLGRLLRPYKKCICNFEYGGDPKCPKCGLSETKKEVNRAIILDHADNTRRLGFAYDDRLPELTQEQKKIKRESTGIIVKTCQSCFAVYSESSCPYCGHENKSDKKVKETDGELDILKSSAERERKILLKNIQKKMRQLDWLARKYKWRENAKWHKLFDDYGEYLEQFLDVIQFPKRLYQQRLNERASEIARRNKISSSKIIS